MEENIVTFQVFDSTYKTYNPNDFDPSAILGLCINQGFFNRLGFDVGVAKICFDKVWEKNTPVIMGHNIFQSFVNSFGLQNKRIYNLSSKTDNLENSLKDFQQLINTLGYDENRLLYVVHKDEAQKILGKAKEDFGMNGHAFYRI